MAWARLDDRWHDHPKTVAAGLEGAGLWAMCLTWAQQARKTSKTPGVVPDAVVTRFAGPKAKKLAALLHQVGYFDDHTDAGWPIHDFGDYLPKYDSAQAAEAGRKGGQAKAGRIAKQTASKPLDEPPSEPEADSQQTAKRNQARADTAASARRNPVPVPEGNSSQSVVSPDVPSASKPDDERTNLDYQDLATRLRPMLGPIDAAWARRVAGQILPLANGDVRNPANYVLRAVRDDPAPYRPTGTPPPPVRDVSPADVVHAEDVQDRLADTRARLREAQA